MLLLLFWVFFVFPPSGLVLTKATSKHYSTVYTKQNTPHAIPATFFLGRGETRPAVLVWHCLFMNYYLSICKLVFKRWDFFFCQPDMSDFSSQERWSICRQPFQSGIEFKFSNSKFEKCKKAKLEFSASITCYCVLKYFHSNRQRIISFIWRKRLMRVPTKKNLKRNQESAMK